MTKGTAANVRQHLQLQAETVGQSYAQAKRVIESYVQATRVWSTSPTAPPAMEVDAVGAKRKGKKKGKNKNKKQWDNTH